MADMHVRLSVWNVLRTKSGMIAGVIVLAQADGEYNRTAHFAYRNGKLARLDDIPRLTPPLFKIMRAYAAHVFQKLKGRIVPENWREILTA